MDTIKISHKYVSVDIDVIDRGLQSKAVKQTEGKVGKDCCYVTERYVGRRRW